MDTETADRDNRSASFHMILVVLGMGLVATVTTITVGYVLTKPPEFVAWTTIGFLCFIEFLLCVLGINSLVGRHRRRRPSGAVLLITYGIVGTYTAAGLLSIIIYSAVRSSSGSGDVKFVVVLVAETVLAFLIATLLYAYDYFLASTSQALTERREHHGEKSRSIRATLRTVGNLVLTDVELLRRRNALTKHLQRLETALGHSHGGGVGSREGGWQHPRDPESEAELDHAVDALNAVGGRLASADPAELPPLLDEMERLTAALDSAADRLQLT